MTAQAKAKHFPISLRWALLALMVGAPTLGAAQPADAAGEDRAEEVGRRLCSLIDLDRPELQEVKRQAQAQHYAQALAAWRSVVVKRLRARNFGQFNFHSYKVNTRQLNIAERLVGHLSEDAYLKADTSHDFFDIYGMSGPPGLGKPIDWLATSPEAKTQEKADYSSYQFAIPLAASFWKTGEGIYTAKWFEISSDFARHQKQAVEQLDAAKRKTYPANWTTDAGAALNQSWRAENIVKCLATFAKSLPPGKPQSWDDVLKPVSAPVEEAALAVIPSVELADVAISLVQDHPTALTERYLLVGAAPSQRRIGLTSLVLIARAFPEFKSSQVLEQQASVAFEDYADSMFYRDGAMLEQAFGYNEYDARSVDELVSTLQPDLPPWAQKMAANVARFRRMTAALATPLNGLPVVGNESSDNPPAIWKDAAVRQQWLDSRGKDRLLSPDPLIARIGANLRGQKEPLPFTSVAFPYGGYYALRSGWNWDSPYLFFMGARPANGHHMMDSNAIQVTAYGRPLLVAAGPPPYNMSFVSDDKRAEFEQLQAFFDESSSWKMNTVLVDGKSQSHNGPEATRAYEKPVPARWHTSPRFDFVEGTYALGYGQKYVPWDPPKDVEMAVRHQRQVLFVRQANFWIVTDILRNSGDAEHDYTQTWNFPPRQDDPKSAVAGFGEAQVLADAPARTIHTADPEGPNLWLYQFGPQALSYTKYFGQKNPYRGWYARGIGDAIPAPSVHVGWKSARSQVLATVLFPSRGQASPIAAMQNLLPQGDGSASGFSLSLPDNSKVVYRTALDTQTLAAGPITANAMSLLLVTDASGKQSGVLLGCRGATVAGRKQTLLGSNFEFELQGGALKIVAPVKAPAGFAWQEGAAGIQPLY